MKNILRKIKFFVEKNKTIANIFRYIYRRTILQIRFKKQNSLLLQNGKEIMGLINEIFYSLEVPYWLEYGTLLGAVRDKGFISHDIDIDLGLFLSDYSVSIEKKFQEKRFTKIRKILIDDGLFGLEETYEYKGISVDLFYFKKENNKIIGYIFTNKEGLSWEKTVKDYGGYLVKEITIPWDGNIKSIQFLENVYPIPASVGEHLAACYGNDFMIKNPNWKPSSMTKNRKMLDNKIGVVVSYV